MTAPMRTLLQTVLDGVQSRPDLDVLTFVDFRPGGGYDQEQRSYRQLLRNGQKLAGALLAQGMKAGDAFALVMRNHPEFVDAMVASEIAGTIFVPVDPRLRGDRLIYMLDFSECRGAIVSHDVAEVLLPLLPRLPRLEWVWVMDGAGDLRAPFRPLRTILALAQPAGDATPRPLDHTMQMLFTSGTTGDPKAILSPYARFAGIAALGEHIGLRSDDRPYTGLSLTHANAQLITLGTSLAMGLRLVISRTFSKSRLWRLLADYECTTFNLLGGMATALFAEPAENDGPHKVRFVLSAGMPPTMWEAFERRFNLIVVEFFGTAEGGFTLNPPGAGPVGSIGKAAPGLIAEILDGDDQPCRPFEPGELCFRHSDGSASPVRYFNNAEASAKKTKGGWMRTGDIGHKDDDGWLYYHYRDGHSVRRNGGFLPVRDMEALVAACPGVVDAYVYGVVTRENTPGEKAAIAAIVTEAPDGFDAAALFTHCRAQKMAELVPNYVQLVKEIPKTASEKPQDRFLLDLLCADECRVFGPDGPTRIEIKRHRD